MKQKDGTNQRKKRWLAVCLILFGLVVLGRGLDVQPLRQMAESVQDTLTQVGTALSRGDPAVETFQRLWAGQSEETP